MHVKLYSDEHGVVGLMDSWCLWIVKDIKTYILKEITACKKKVHTVLNLQDFFSTSITERGSSLFDWLC